MKLVKGSKSVLLSVFLLCYAGALYSQQLAFPTAEGYGKYAVGGRGGKVIEVTNLNSSGQGSFAAAVAASGPRTVVFRVSGTIDADVTISNDYITIAGQTAPGDGITLKGSLGISASEVIIRYIRARAEASGDAVGGGHYDNNIILDHISASWSSDEVFSVYQNHYVTIQWCMITEACGNGHNFGGIWGNEYSTYHHNLFAHNLSRTPRWCSGAMECDYRNNVVYNWGHNSCYGGEPQQSGRPYFDHTTINMIANYCKAGPATQSGVRDRIANPSSGGSWYVAENYVDGYPAVTADNWLGVDGSGFTKLTEPWDAMPINQQTAEDAYQTVLDYAGCSFPNRDPVDARIIEEVRNGTTTYGNNGIINNPSEVGGWPALAAGTPYTDSDHDGMSDDWEDANGLNKNDPEDRNNIGEGGYTNLEIYLNAMISYPTGIKESAGLVPAEFTLEQNYPNPFNPTTKIEFSISEKTKVKLEVFNIKGSSVAILLDEVRTPGNYSVEFNGSNLSSGFYVYKLTTDNDTFSRKMLLLK